ncbi:Nucleoid occlusion protein [Symmachiella dynata]|uniref:Nucleoid occlusion protein n=1 Tax=Symmachiella dynata TaxID=2527995 RepID=A0A517ZQ73_9PLAN|nr:ParB N-terminal domain-containing protein [Symmachiella dynata]QDU44597.1 Nucleoid occlusion protein [Symmachiella dynata]
MKIEQWRIDRVKPYEQNPRINDQAVDAVAKSIEQFGFRQPVVVDEEGVIIAGHTRWKASQKLGLKKVPIHVAMGLSPAQARAYRLADNKTNELAEWDPDLLSLELADLQAMGFDLELTGFSEDELAKWSSDEMKEGLTDPDDVPETLDEPITQPGDLWLLGSHRLFCGDSTSIEDTLRVMDGEKAALVATDPPYLVDYTGDRPNESGKDWSDTYREIDISDADAFFTQLFTCVLGVVAPKAAIYCWHAHKRVRCDSTDLGSTRHSRPPANYLG